MPTAARARSFSETFRDAILDADVSVRELGRLASVDATMIYRFIAEDPEQHRDLTTRTVDRLVAALGLKLIETPGRKRRRPTPARRVGRRSAAAPTTESRHRRTNRSNTKRLSRGRDPAQPLRPTAIRNALQI